MILWEITSYRRALRLEAERHAEIARMEMTYGRRWRRQAPAHERMALRLAAVAPAELLPSLTKTINAAPPDRTAGAPREAAPAEVAPAEAEVTRPDPIPDLPPVEPKMGSPRKSEPVIPSEATRTKGSARERAVALLATEPDIPGTELARRLGVTTGYGRRLRSELLNTTSGYR
jgi:hypothetical protein